jgi:hypothetical protein
MGKKVKGPHEDLTYRIIGAAMAVHRRIGPGHKEVIYQRALEKELTQAGLSFEAQKNIPVYDGDRLLGFYIPVTSEVPGTGDHVSEPYGATRRPFDQLWWAELALAACLSLTPGHRISLQLPMDVCARLAQNPKTRRHD